MLNFSVLLEMLTTEVEYNEQLKYTLKYSKILRQNLMKQNEIQIIFPYFRPRPTFNLNFVCSTS